MNKAKLVNSVLTGGGIGSPQHLNVVIGNEDKGFPRGHVLDANATLALAGAGGGNSGTQGGLSDLDKIIKIDKQESSYGSEPIEIKNITTGLKTDAKFANIVLQSNSYKNDILTNNVKSDSSIIAGCLNNSYGGKNIIIGSGSIVLSKSYGNFSSSTHAVIKVVKNTENANLRLEVKKNSIIEYSLKKGLLSILNDFAVNTIDGKNKIIETPDNSNVISRVSNSFTRIDDDTIEMDNNNLRKFRDNYAVIAACVWIEGCSSSIVSGTFINCIGHNSIYVGVALLSNEVSEGIGPNSVACFGYGNTVSNFGELACGRFNTSSSKKKDTDDFRYSTLFSVGGGTLPDNNFNIIECALKNKDLPTGKIRETEFYVKGIGGYDGTNVASTQSKSLQQVISDIETAVQLNSNGPWDIDITSEFVNGNVTIKPLSMWSISQGIKRVYFTANLKQGDVITIPNTLRMYIGWKKAENRFGMADWATAGKKYTVTEDSYYVILIATENDNPGVQTNTLPSYGKVMLRTSNPEFKPTAKTDAKKDHTNDDKVMRSIAHQGFHKMERPNSLAAFRAAAKEGWRYVETDIYKTSDNNWVVGHDAWMPEGYTNGTITITSGDHSYKYEQHTLAEIQAFTGPDNNKVATLQEFCKVCKKCGLHPYIEIKSPDMGGKQTGVGDKYDNRPYIHKALDIIRREGLGKEFTIISSGNWNLEETVEYDNTIRVGYINVFEMYNVNSTDKKYWDTTVLNLTKIINAGKGRAVYLFLDQNLTHVATCPAENIDWLIDKKIPLEVWTAKTKEDVGNLDPYITGVTCDNIHAGEILAKDI